MYYGSCFLSGQLSRFFVADHGRPSPSPSLFFLDCESEVFIDKRDPPYGGASTAAERERQENVLLHANVYTG